MMKSYDVWLEKKVRVIAESERKAMDLAEKEGWKAVRARRMVWD